MGSFEPAAQRRDGQPAQPQRQRKKKRANAGRAQQKQRQAAKRREDGGAPRRLAMAKCAQTA